MTRFENSLIVKRISGLFIRYNKARRKDLLGLKE